MTPEDDKKVVEVTIEILHSLEKLFKMMKFDSTFVLMHIFNPPQEEEGMRDVWTQWLAEMNERYFIKQGSVLTFVPLEDVVKSVKKLLH